MVDAVVGAVIIAVATTSLLLAVEVMEDAFTSAGRSRANGDEQVLLESLRQKYPARSSALQLSEDQLTNKLPRQYQ
tara:strand:+ start:232 stop:459 length:228 start_codon:yes stop_codon:yes gene_type:complete